ncbi:hypothetical protein GIB67_040892 [Kingdonia uniflora]|uniref:DUF8040 domain-containing protein n=1 Tax=Kingdonia uniflora TaxID=39325 RepID=A0A7J7L880_9MAGN|nr:hypothetical protein GIB67_040892 [Kingdonia uniflora]
MDRRVWTTIQLIALMLGFQRVTRKRKRDKLCVSILTGRGRISEILNGPNKIAYDTLRMNKGMFVSLCGHFRVNKWVKDSQHIDVEQKMAIFLETIAHVVGNCIMKQKYQHLGETISKCFHKVLRGMLHFSKETIVPPYFKEPREIRTYKQLREGPFKGVIGVIDVTLVSTQVSKEDLIPFRARGKGEYIQNLLGVCDFDFIYVQAGWEGTTHDSNVLDQTVRDPANKFSLPPTQGWALFISANTLVVVVIEEAVMAVEEEDEKALRERDKRSGNLIELSEGDKRLRRAKDSGSCWWLYSSVVRGKFDSTTDSHSDTEDVKSTLDRMESLLDEVTEEETELELVLEGLGLSRKKKVDSRSNKTPRTGSSAQPHPVKPSKVALKYLKKRMLKALSASGTTGSSEVAKDMRRRVKPSGESGEKVVKGRSTTVDYLKESKKGQSWRFFTEKKIQARWTDALKEVRQLKTFHALVIGQLQVETKANHDEMVEERDRLGHYLMLKGYSEQEVDAIKADTYVEEEDEEEAEAVEIVDGLDGVSRQTVLNNQGDDVELPKGGSEKAVREMSLRINDLESGLARERETSKALLSTQAELCNHLNERVARLKAELAQAIACAKKAEIKERSGGSRTERHVQKGNTNLRECQHKLDVTLIREKVLEREIKAKESLMKRKEELLKDIPAREELNA